ncbi:hypothetical protein KEM55_008435, partial [Ascosphaera atra]
ECKVLLATTGVGHEIEGIRALAGDDSVVNDTASLWIKKTGESSMIILEGVQRGRGNLHEELRCTGTGELVLNPKEEV